MKTRSDEPLLSREPLLSKEPVLVEKAGFDMVKPRVIETTEGIQGEFDVEMYDRMMRRMRNKGWLETGLILKAGIDKGTALEVGPGPGYFDGVFTNGSLHEWAEPKRVFNEIHRVLKPGGNYCISDLRRDMHPFIKWFMKAVTRPKEMRPGLISSIRAAYTAEEVQTLLGESDLDTYGVDKGAMGITITGQKTG